jgi:hypothetical protein
MNLIEPLIQYLDSSPSTMDDFIFIFVLLTQYIGSCPIMDGVDVGNFMLYSMINIEAIPSVPQYKFCNEICIFTC